MHHYRDTALGTVLCLKDQQMARPIFLEILLLTINFVSIRLMMGQLRFSSQSLLHAGNGEHAECAK